MAKISNLKLPPQNLEAEQSVLGSLMIDKNAIIQIADILSAQDFYHPQNAKIFEAMLELYEKHQPIDILSVAAKLKEKQINKEVGGSSYLSKLVDMVPTASHIAHYAKIVKEKKVLRDLIHASADITEKAFNISGDLEETLDSIEQKIFSISQRSISQKFTLVRDELPKTIERIEKLQRGELGSGGLPTGFQKLDNILSGLRPSDFIVIGARPSVGKTSFALDIARHIGVKEKQPIGVFSLEMSKDQILDRLVSAEAGVPLWQLRSGRLNDEEHLPLIQMAYDRLSQAPIFIDDTPSPNILQMRSMARRLQTECGLSAIIVDYLQLIQPRINNDNVVQQITEISRNLKALGRELNVPVIALSQLSRAVEQRDSRAPRLADLRESGSIEQDADVVILMYRKTPNDKHDSNDPSRNIATVNVAKHRNGPLGEFELFFDSEKASFRDVDTSHTYK